MTAAGGSVGHVLVRVADERIWAERATLFGAIFHAADYRPSSYDRMVFFLPIYVACLFALRGL